MRMLTLHRPWAWCVVYGGKLVENRPMKPPPAVLGKWMAIHAGKTWSDADAERITAAGIVMPPEEDQPAGAIIGVCRVIGYATHVDEVVRRLGEEQRRWFFGPYGWLLADMHPLPRPVFERGFQGVPHIPEWTLSAVRAQVELPAIAWVA
jgi:hypothetical protein